MFNQSSTFPAVLKKGKRRNDSLLQWFSESAGKLAKDIVTSLSNLIAPFTSRFHAILAVARCSVYLVVRYIFRLCQSAIVDERDSSLFGLQIGWYMPQRHRACYAGHQIQQLHQRVEAKGGVQNVNL